ncbi:rhomboid family intramembrane serine protease [candidate division WOR-3 bacterium]|nr:rhomboid family intramembrane serine protease [candidate division WOR-3 bacterium]MCK4527334.1 rhomboid family intramembrane serine protease [candidate division WOR-3 bacterium]
MILRETQNGLRKLIIANVAVFFLQMILSTAIPFVHYFALIPRLFMKGWVWQGVTYMFLHGGLFHLFINMYILWMFGRELEYMWGTKEFYKYYFICGVGAAFIYSLFNMNSYIPVVGASGAVFGILLAYGITFPRRKLLIFPFFIPLEARYAVLLFGGIELLMLLVGGGNIAHLAHLGGLAVGYLYLRWKRRYLY